ncbi:hypothetical protein V8J88_07745 [Massilia sp. W12]|uniref:hypothetical protein n=1 Tax=Massilia sp. W12 TaxID=3126507 RepID=UPI0030CF9D11
MDILQWQTLLGQNNPLTNSVPGVLYLLRCILQTCHPFHAMGYVHNDLHLGNLVVEYQYDWFSHSITLQPQHMRMIDFEFACYPRADHPRAQKEKFQPRPASWSDLIVPGLHSPHVCPYEVEQALTNDSERRSYRRYRQAADGNYIAQAQSLEKIDFGVDFFTLGQALDGLLLQVENEWDDDETLRWAEAESYLRRLPQILREWDKTVPEEIRPVPHLELLAEIDGYLGDWPRRCNWQVRLAGRRQWRFGKRAWWGGGLVLAAATATAAAVGGLVQETPAPPKPEPPYEFAVRRDELGKELDLAADDSLSVVWNKKEYKGQIKPDGKFLFTLPSQARGTRGDLRFYTKGKHAVVQQSLELVGEIISPSPRAWTQRVVVKVTAKQSEQLLSDGNVWTTYKDAVNSGNEVVINAEPIGKGGYILHLPLDLMVGKISACAPKFKLATQYFDLRQGASAYSREMDLEVATEPYPACPPT